MQRLVASADPEFQAAEDEDDDRPECEYGVDCYRKNPQHRKDLKHTRKALPKRKAKAKAAKAKRRRKDDDDEGEDGSYDDSFIDDESGAEEDIRSQSNCALFSLTSSKLNYAWFKNSIRC